MEEYKCEFYLMKWYGDHAWKSGLVKQWFSSSSFVMNGFSWAHFMHF